MGNVKRCEWTQRKQGNREIENLNRNKGNVGKRKNRGKGERNGGNRNGGKWEQDE